LCHSLFRFFLSDSLSEIFCPMFCPVFSCWCPMSLTLTLCPYPNSNPNPNVKEKPPKTHSTHQQCSMIEARSG